MDNNLVCPNCRNTSGIVATHVGRTTGTIIGGILGALAGFFIRFRLPCPLPGDIVIPDSLSRAVNTITGLFSGASLGHDVGSTLDTHLTQTHYCPKCHHTFPF